jgi:hypothetical protein
MVLLPQGPLVPRQKQLWRNKLFLRASASIYLRSAPSPEPRASPYAPLGARSCAPRVARREPDLRSRTGRD